MTHAINSTTKGENVKEKEYLEAWLMGVLRALVEVGADDEAFARLTTEAVAIIWVLDRELTWAGAMVQVQERTERLLDELGMSESDDGDD